MAWIPAVIGGVVTLIGGAFSADQNRRNAHSAQDFAAAQTDTAMQRRERDLIRAGYSPMLAYQQGGAQSAPGVFYNTPNYVGEAVQAGVGAYSAAKQAESIEAGVDKAMAEIRNIDSDTALRKVQAKIAGLEYGKLQKLIPILLQREQADLARHRVGQSTLENMSSEEGFFWSWLTELGHSIGGAAADASDEFRNYVERNRGNKGAWK